jgi:putative nucleotidyltransferase with HDIG domain
MLRTRVRVGPTSGLVLSVLFAALFTAVGTFELFVPSFAPAYGQPSRVTLRVPHGVRIVKQAGVVVDVEFENQPVVIPPGTQLLPSVEDHRVVVEFHQARRPPSPLRLGGAFCLYLFGCLVLTNYFQRFGHGRLRLLRAQAGLFSLMALAVVAAKAMLLFTALPAYWIPVSTIAFWAAVGFDRRTALLVDVAISFFVASLVRFDLMLLTVFFTRGIVATLLFKNRKQPRQMLSAGLLSGVAAAVAYIALIAVLEGGAGIVGDVSLGLGSHVLACVGGGLFSGLLANALREPAELTLGHVGRGRLLDLTDIEAPLLRKMATEAPGSWEHSRAMANLAEAASAAIGADSLLTRVGAYYHDLGKTVQAKFFIENLSPGEQTPHDDLEPEVSADAIMAHVVLGTKILRDGGVPEPVVEFAYTHHGTQVVEYFWNKYRKAADQREADGEEFERLDASYFRYPGMKPMTKETAILMLVDSIEAASRTIQPPNHDKFDEMIRRVVFHKLTSGQLDDSGLTLTDLRIMTERMASALVNMYHGRIKYPWQKKKEQEEQQAQEEAEKKKDE